MKLTEQDFERAAKKLKCEVASIKAVAEVESRGNGFYASGFPVILFERHIFRKYTNGRYNKSHPHLSGPAGNYGAAGRNQIRKFNEAFALDPIAAMKSCSWGKFQIMGFNHAVCGYETVGEFVDAMKESEGKHLDAFVEFVIANKLAGHLRTKDWASFAKGYNGAGYQKNKYDTKMANAYKRHSVVKSTSPADKPADSPPTDDTAIAPTPPTNTVAIEGVKPYRDIGLGSVLKNDAKTILPANIGLNTVSEWIQQSTGWPQWLVDLLPKLVIVLIVCTALWLLYRVVTYVMHNFRENERVKLMAQINADPKLKDIVLK